MHGQKPVHVWQQRTHAAGQRLEAVKAQQRVEPHHLVRHAVQVRGGGGRHLHPTERQLAARGRFDGALELAGPGLSDILWRVVCAGEGLPQAERELAWPVRSGKLVLKLALGRVASFYRVPG